MAAPVVGFAANSAAAACPAVVDARAVVGFDAGALAAAAVPDCAFAAVPAGLAAEVGLDAARGLETVPAFGAEAVARFAAVPALGFDAVAGFAAVALDAVPAFGFVAVVVFAFGLRALEPASRARCVRDAVGAGVPVLVPPARGVGAGLSTVVSGS